MKQRFPTHPPAAHQAERISLSDPRKTDDACQIVTLDEKVIERVSVYKYLGFLLEESLYFKQHIECLTKKLRVKLGFYYRHIGCFSFSVRKTLIQATFLSMLDYGDILYMHAHQSSLKMLDSVYHATDSLYECWLAVFAQS